MCEYCQTRRILIYKEVANAITKCLEQLDRADDV